MTALDPSTQPESGTHVVGRRRFLGYVLAAPTLVAAAEFAVQPGAEAAVPSPGVAELMDLNDLLTAAAQPTANLITVAVHTDGTVSFELPRAEVGQGITTSTAMLIAEEMDLPLEKVRVTLADARPELMFNQLTGGSNTTISTYTPIRVAAAIAKGRLLQAAAIQLDSAVTDLTARAGVITSVLGGQIDYGSLAEKAASARTEQVSVDLKPRSDFKIIGTPRNRIDALAAVTGRKTFAMDLDVPDALPTMVCRAPTINGTVESVANLAEVRQMPGVTDVAVISTGVAVRAQTFGQCIDGVRALRVTWNAGTAAGKSDESVLQELKSAELPLAPPVGKTVEGEFTFYFRGNSALEPNCAIADVRADRAEIWGSLKSPIVAQETIATKLGLPPNAVAVHVVEGGGSFGRKLFSDAALEAAEISQQLGKPVKLMWHRADDCRQGRTHPMSTSRIRVGYAADTVLSYDQRHTSVSTDFGHGVGEVLTAMAAQLPVGDLGFSETIFQLTQSMPYDFGAAAQLLNEVDKGFNTSSMRNIYSPDVTCARELIVDRLAAVMGQDPYQFRRAFLQDDRSRAVLDKVAEVGGWGRTMPANMAQGIAFHAEYHGVTAALVEIDCRPETVNRPIRDAVSGPRVTKAVFAVDVGLAVNPRGVEAQMMGGIMDGIAQVLTSSLHLAEGHFLEASWDNYFYTRQWNTPLDVRVIVMPPTTGEPGGAGELGVAASMSAVACAYGRATGSMPTSFPINHGTLSFEPKPTVPPIPESPTDGLDHAY
ncbi:molybdopterin-dependent oxidoreductase [Saccharopolyspora sp. K220]|uniref:molybdopterin cofactor-binding domain-containing protein n=1 Tax=Saccharopolyspora soli TaxID=2926618 RepID=UPI001F5A62B7|nr:molybdopterin cofactor-binding domain-containing protein [Saccharopolyspora soli]MCI2418340.1 molybdopterin-dependent oxidoreductase [Saccharopolyspora soli]